MLVDHLEQVQIAYFGQLGRRTEPAWHASWSDPRTLPTLIRISVDPANAARWPVLIARPLTGANSMPVSEPVVEPPTEASPGEVPK